MNNTQNQKIAQVTDKTLIVGIDIGGEKHFARAILARGYEVSKAIPAMCMTGDAIIRNAERYCFHNQSTCFSKALCTLQCF